MRLTVRTPEVAERICAALRLGASFKDACAAAGLHLSTFNDWKSSDPDFADQLEAAKADHRMMALRQIRKAARRGTWQAASYLLERHARQELKDAPDVGELQAAAERGVTAADAAVMWQRQLQVLELAYQRGELDAMTYLSHMARLTAEARHLAELRLRQLAPEGAPQVQMALTLDSTGIRDPAPLPDGVQTSKRALAGGDLIDVG